MGKRRADSPDEFDVVTRDVGCCTGRRGEVAGIKRRMRRRERREARQQLRRTDG